MAIAVPRGVRPGEPVTVGVFHGMPRTEAAIWLVGTAFLAAIVFFDLGPPLAYNDDWGFAWSARHFASGHFSMYPADSALALPQVAFAALVTAGHTDQRILRLTLVPFVVLAGFCSHRLASMLGAGRFWSAVAAVALVASPVYASDATTFMTDIPYVALVLGAALAGAVWLRDGRLSWLCVLLAVLCPLQRQTGALLAPALTVAVLWVRGRRLRRADTIALATLWIGVILAIWLPAAIGMAPPTQGQRLGQLAGRPFYIVLAALLFIPPMLGMAVLPFAAGLLDRAPTGSRDWRGPLFLGLLAWEAAMYFLVGMPLFPGNLLQAHGLGAPSMVGAYLKPSPYPDALYALYGVLYIVAGAIVLAWRHRDWRAHVRNPIVALLACMAAAQVGSLLVYNYVAFDRYYLPLGALIVPFMAVLASRTARPRPAAAIAISSLLVGLLMYAAGQQDYQAWIDARDQAARMAFAQFPPDRVDAGYEANAVYVEIPTYERTGRILSGLAHEGAYDYSLDGPTNPVLRLQFAAADDPRPGVSYQSLAPGRIVIARVKRRH